MGNGQAGRVTVSYPYVTGDNKLRGDASAL
jgi:hypothetical protein